MKYVQQSLISFYKHRVAARNLQLQIALKALVLQRQLHHLCSSFSFDTESELHPPRICSLLKDQHFILSETACNCHLTMFHKIEFSLQAHCQILTED